ncbi:hypothetical protein HZS_899 [Henneguya salminicola]|nr:hypothetical protein HZS_899 [Henneguya salminicola]
MHLALKSRPCPTNVANRIALELKPLSESVKNVIDRLTSIANSLEGTNQPPPETKLSNQLLGDLNSMTLLSSTTTTQHARINFAII